MPEGLADLTPPDVLGGGAWDPNGTTWRGTGPEVVASGAAFTLGVTADIAAGRVVKFDVGGVVNLN